GGGTDIAEYGIGSQCCGHIPSVRAGVDGDDASGAEIAQYLEREMPQAADPDHHADALRVQEIAVFADRVVGGETGVGERCAEYRIDTCRTHQEPGRMHDHRFGQPARITEPVADGRAAPVARSQAQAVVLPATQAVAAAAAAPDTVHHHLFPEPAPVGGRSRVHHGPGHLV